MAKYVTQWGDYFYTLRKTNGYDRKSFLGNGTPVTDEEWRKLFYACEERKQTNSILGKFTDYTCKGNAKEIIGRDVVTYLAK